MPKRSLAAAAAEPSGGSPAKQAAEPDSAPSPLSASKKKQKRGALAPSVEPTRVLKDKALKIAAQLKVLFPNPLIPLDHGSHFQLLVAVMLSAQTTDVKVNEVTPALFKQAPDALAMSVLQVDAIQQYIRVLGLAPTKAKNLSLMSKILVQQHGGAVPDTFEALEALPGVGHKTASVVMSQAFGRAAFPVDTHIHRLATRWGLTNGKSVEQTEADLKALLPESIWRDVHLQIIYFGRQHCPAQRHDSRACPICSWATATPQQHGGSISRAAHAAQSEGGEQGQEEAEAKSAALSGGGGDDGADGSEGRAGRSPAAGATPPGGRGGKARGRGRAKSATTENGAAAADDGLGTPSPSGTDGAAAGKQRPRKR